MLLLIGAGSTSRDYIKTLHLLGVKDIDILSRRPDPAMALCQEFGLGRGFGGGLETLPRIVGGYRRIIVASPMETLLPYLAALAELTTVPVLIEKPVSLASSDLAAHVARHPEQNRTVMVALNRLFYPSVVELRRRLETEPVRSVDFAFTEWLHRLNLSQYAPEVLARWGLGNSLHVMSTVFDLIGQPQALHAEVAGRGEVAWHPAGSAFLGAGRSERGIPFAYAADWLSAGRWSAAFRTAEGAYHLEPFEGLSYCPKGTVTRTEVVPVWNGEFKCGFEGMVRCWMGEAEVEARYSLKRMVGHLATVERMMYAAEI